MSELEKTARQALKCLDWMADSDAPAPDVSFAKCAADLRRALQSGTDVEQQPADEPAAWMKEGWGPDCGPYIEFYRDDEMGWRDRKEWTPLYTRPQPAREWVGLTDEEVDECYYWKGRQWTTDELVRHVEAKLREKNA